MKNRKSIFAVLSSMLLAFMMIFSCTSATATNSNTKKTFDKPDIVCIDYIMIGQTHQDIVFTNTYYELKIAEYTSISYSKYSNNNKIVSDNTSNYKFISKLNYQRHPSIHISDYSFYNTNSQDIPIGYSA